MEILNLHALKSEPSININKIDGETPLSATITKVENKYIIYFHQFWDIIKKKKEEDNQ